MAPRRQSLSALDVVFDVSELPAVRSSSVVVGAAGLPTGPLISFAQQGNSGRHLVTGKCKEEA
jgi:hypothetical protein